MEHIVFVIGMVLGTFVGVGLDIYLAIDYKKRSKKVPQIVLMLIIFGSVLLSMPISGIAIVLIRWIGAVL